MKDFLRVSDLDLDDFEYLMAEAAAFQVTPRRREELLGGEIVGMYFAKPSTRTRYSFELAIRRLGGAPLFTGIAELQLGHGETVEDTARTLSRYARALVVRTSSHSELECFAAAATIPVVNALTDDHHPCQALADVLTLRQFLPALRGAKVAFVGDGDNVCHSLIEVAALAGMTLHVATPPAFAPSPAIVAQAQERARVTGATIEITTDPRHAVSGAAAVYTDTWLSMGSPPEKRELRLAAFEPFQVNEPLMALADPGAVFMHCLPAHRGEEVTAGVIDGPKSIVFDQADNRTYTGQAVLAALVNRRLHGAPVLGPD